MAQVSREQLQEALANPNARAFLDMLSKAEGTSVHGYQTAFGGGKLEGLTDHPRKLHSFTQTDGKVNKTSAAGRYQFLQGTWDGLAKQYGFTDFGAENQDMGALALLAEVGALEDVLSGNFGPAVQKAGTKWASLPSSPYPQHKRSGEFIKDALGQPSLAADDAKAMIAMGMEGYQAQALVTTAEEPFTGAASGADLRKIAAYEAEGPSPTGKNTADLIATQAWRDTTNWFQRVGVAYDNTMMGGVWDQVTAPNFKQDFTFDYGKAVEGKPDVFQYTGSLEFFAGTKSQEEFDWRLKQWEERMEGQKVMSAGSGVGNFMAGAVADMLDPFSYIAGIGGGVAAGRLIKSGIGAYAVGGALGNTLYDAGRAATGQDVGFSEFVTSVALGATLGGAGYHFTGGTKRDAERRFADLSRKAAQHEQKLVTEAQAELGPGATPQAIREAVTAKREAEVQEILRFSTAEVPPEEWVMPLRPDDAEAAQRSAGTPLRDPVAGYTQPAQRAPEEASGVLGTLGRVAQAVRDTISPQRRPVQESPLTEAIPNLTERTEVEAILARADEMVPTLGIDQSRLIGLPAFNNMLMSHSTTMLKSGNPVAMMFAAKILESPQGAVRGRSAAITHAMLDRQFMGNAIYEYESAFRAWRTAEGRKGIFGVEKDRIDFDEAVAVHREAARRGTQVAQRNMKEIQAASESLTRQFEIIKQAEIKAKVAGWGTLVDSDSSTYVPWRASMRKWNRMTGGEKRTIIKALAREVQMTTRKLDPETGNPVKDSGWSSDKALTFAQRWVDDQIQKPMAGGAAPSIFPDPRDPGVIQRTLQSLGFDDATAEAMAQQYTRGGARQTKSRFERNLLNRYEVEGEFGPNGEPKTISLMDVMETDNIGLLMQQARATSGQVAMAQYGLQSKAAIATYRKALEVSSNADHRLLQAFDEVVAEMTGLPSGTVIPTFIQTGMALTSLARLGGNVFSQLGEMGNIVGTFGITAAFKGFGQLPRLFKEVGVVAKGGTTDNPLLSQGFQDATGYIGMELYRNHRPHMTNAGDNEAFMRAEAPAITRIIRSGGYVQGKITFWQQLHAAQTRLTQEMAINHGLRYIREGGKGNAALKDMGISEELAARVRKELDVVAAFDADGKVMGYDPRKGEDTAALQEFHTAIDRGVSQIIQGTFVGERGAWAHNAWMKFATQFRTYSLVSIEKQAFRQVRNHGAWKAFGVFMGTMSVVAPIYAVRVLSQSMGREDQDAYLERMLAPGAFMSAVIGYTSQAGAPRDAVDLISTAFGFSVSGHSARGAGGGSFVSNTIPALGMMDDFMKALKGLASPLTGEGKLEDVTKVLPFSRAPGAVQLLNTLQ